MGLHFGIKGYELSFDIDYILDWINPDHRKEHFEFMIVPATLVFRNVYDLHINLATVDVITVDIYRDNPVKPHNAKTLVEKIEYTWTTETTNGEISFKSVGYNQYARKRHEVLTPQSINSID